jgi:hypothetical protein
LADLMQDEGANAATAEANAERILQRRLDREERYLPGLLQEWVAYLGQSFVSWVHVPRIEQPTNSSPPY